MLFATRSSSSEKKILVNLGQKLLSLALPNSMHTSPSTTLVESLVKILQWTSSKTSRQMDRYIIPLLSIELSFLFAQVIVLTGASIEKQLEINDWTHQNDIPFIAADTNGLFG